MTQPVPGWYPDPSGNDSSHTGVSYLTYGKQVCQALQSGASPGSEIGRLEGITSNAESELIVTGARQYLCP